MPSSLPLLRIGPSRTLRICECVNLARFGVNKLPKLGKGLGEGIRNFKDSIRTGGDGDDPDSNTNESNEPK